MVSGDVTVLQAVSTWEALRVVNPITPAFTTSRRVIFMGEPTKAATISSECAGLALIAWLSGAEDVPFRVRNDLRLVGDMMLGFRYSPISE
jgi:hypothetical protein